MWSVSADRPSPDDCREVECPTAHQEDEPDQRQAEVDTPGLRERTRGGRGQRDARPGEVREAAVAGRADGLKDLDGLAAGSGDAEIRRLALGVGDPGDPDVESGGVE